LIIFNGIQLRGTEAFLRCW